MASEGLGLGKEVVHGLMGGTVLIVIGVTIGSMIAQVLSHGPETIPASEAGAAAPASTEADQNEVKAQEPDPAQVNERLE